MNRVLVTGASGLIGQNCLPLLIDQGFDTHAVTRRPMSRTPGVTWHQFDLQAPGRVETLLAQVRPTHLLHLAWFTAPGSFWQAAENLLWLETSLELFRKFPQFGGRRIVATGSCAEYDWSAGVCSEFRTPCLPGTTYGRAKLAAATYLQAVQASDGLSTAWARLFFLYGPQASVRRMPGVVISALSRGEPVECSAGTQQRDFLFVPDAADAVVRLLTSDVTGPVNVCSGSSIAIRDLALQAAQLMGRTDLLRLGALPSNEPPLVVGDPARLVNELNWKPRYSLADGLRQTVDELCGSPHIRCA